jgi:hypothetical protein
MPVIEHSIKDKLLTHIVLGCPVGSWCEKDCNLSQELGVTGDVIAALFTNFQNEGLVSDFGMDGTNGFYFRTTVSAHDLYQTGGFTFRQAVMKQQIEKLLLEIDVLKKELGPDRLETLNKLSSIGQAIVAAFSLWR